MAEILLEQEVPQGMEGGDVSKRCDPAQNKWRNRSGKGELCSVGQQGLGNGKAIPNLQHSLERPPELQEWCPGGKQMVEVPKRDLPYVIFGYFKAGV